MVICGFLPQHPMRMTLHWIILCVTLLTVCPGTYASIIREIGKDRVIPENSTGNSVTKRMDKADTFEDDIPINRVNWDIGHESSNFFTDIGPPTYGSDSFDSPEYESLFDGFPNMPYFPEFGEIFRIQKTTTPQPPFSFPDYVRDPFSGDRSKDHRLKDDRPKRGNSLTGGRRPSRRPPRPASSGTKTKLVKQNHSEPKQKIKPGKTKTHAKSREYAKIFRFTADRVNLAEFDMRKKMNGNYLTLAKGDDLDSDKIQRNKFLILHGGVFELDNPSTGGLYEMASSNIESVTSSEPANMQFGDRKDVAKSEDVTVTRDSSVTPSKLWS